MKKLYLFAFILMGLFILFSVDTFALTDSQWDIYKAKLPLNTPRYCEPTIDNGKVYEFDPYYFDHPDYGYIVYGSPKDVPGNERKRNGFLGTDEYRYLGYTREGNKFSNMRFPNDADSKTPLEEKYWLFQPWRWGLCIDNDFSTNPLFRDMVNSGQTFKIKNGRQWYGTVYGQPCGVTEWWGYGLVLSPSTLKDEGAVRFWHVIMD